jgi:dephospho-CoA kinase
VARILHGLGACILDTDQLAREAVAPGSDALREIAREWPAVVREECLDRAALAEIVFSDSRARERLNAIVHPHVRRLAQENERYAKPGQLVVHVVPLLFETGYEKRVDKTMLVVAPLELRLRRIMERDRMTEDHARSRMAAQIDPEDARTLADYVIENDGDLAHLRLQVTSAYERLQME